MIKKVLNKFGIDKAIAYSSTSRIIQAGGGFVTVFLIAFCLTPSEQGYYYTFGSVLAIQIFFELGLGGIITQYVAYEAAYLTINDRHEFIGDDYYKSRLASLMRLFFRWYVVICAILIIVLLIVGFSFFMKFGDESYVIWKTPWILISIITGISLFISPYIAFMQGIGKVKDVALMGMFSQFFQILCVWFVLLCGGKLFASVVSAFCLVIVQSIYLFRNARPIVLNLWKIKVVNKISYKNEIFPYQWKIALSWISGYFIFQLFNPVLFAYCGAKVAGQMGMTLTALNGIMSLTLSWTSTKIPFWSNYISIKDYVSLDKSFFKTLKDSSVVCALCLLIFLSFIFILYILNISLYNRFISYYLCAILMITIFVNNIVNAWATYLRCHKKEPFLVQAIIIGLLSALSTFISGKYFGLQGVVYGYTFVVSFISLPLSYYIFKTKRLEFHE